jgi:hypothetical protein
MNRFGIQIDYILLPSVDHSADMRGTIHFHLHWIIISSLPRAVSLSPSFICLARLFLLSGSVCSRPQFHTTDFTSFLHLWYQNPNCQNFNNKIPSFYKSTIIATSHPYSLFHRSILILSSDIHFCLPNGRFRWYISLSQKKCPHISCFPHSSCKSGLS